MLVEVEMVGTRGRREGGVGCVECVECSSYTEHCAEVLLMHTHNASRSQACRCWRKCCTCCTWLRRIEY